MFDISQKDGDLMDLIDEAIYVNMSLKKSSQNLSFIICMITNCMWQWIDNVIVLTYLRTHCQSLYINISQLTLIYHLTVNC